MHVKKEGFVRIDIIKYEDEFCKLLKQFEIASTYEVQRNWFIKLNEHRFVFETSYNYVRLQHFRDINNKSYKDEYIILNMLQSQYLKLVGDYYESILNAKFRSQLEDCFGTQLFRLAEIKLKTYSDEVAEDIQKENQLIMEYETLLGNAVINFNNEEINLSAISPYLTSSDRTTRKLAHEKKSQFFYGTRIST